jgi:hypothetical protein
MTLKFDEIMKEEKKDSAINLTVFKDVPRLAGKINR